jgi:SAM-dependent methyltransferase
VHVIKRNTCRICGSPALKRVIDLGFQHLQGSFIKKGAFAPMRKLPMQLVRCDPHVNEKGCGLLQAAYTVPPEMMYQTYWYRSSTNATMINHLKDVAEAVCAQLGREPESVLDIGCNDGTLLKAFDAVGTKERWGIDPSNIAASVGEPFKIINDFFPSLVALAGIGAHKFDAITALAMFYDLEDPVGFVGHVRQLLKDDGIFCFEMSHMPAMLAQNSYDTICHEHVEYYSFAVLEEICRRAGMRAFHITENAINGGSIRVFAVKDTNARPISDAVGRMRAREFDLKLDTDDPYSEFQKRAELHRTDLVTLLRRIKAEGKRVHVYGASTKGNTLLQWCEIDGRLVEAAADRNPDKNGARTPGTEIPIISEAQSRDMRPDYYLVLPWHFRAEFIERERQMLARGVRFIFPLPDITVIGEQRHEWS